MYSNPLKRERRFNQRNKTRWKKSKYFMKTSWKILCQVTYSCILALVKVIEYLPELSMQFVSMVTGAVHYDRPSVKKPEKPTYKKRAEADLKHALEKAEELDKNTFQILDGNQDKRAQLVLIRREAERTKRENKAQKQRNRKNREVDEAEMENKRQANLKKYNEIFLAQGEKVDELTSKLKWLKIKQNGKQRRIDCIVSGQKRSAHQKIQLAGLKRSSKKLEATITRTKAEICRRKETMDNLSDLQEKCKINPDPLNENPTFTGFDLASLPVKRCWGVDSGDKLGTDEEGAPSTISSSEYNSFDEDSDDAEISSMKTERPRTHNIVNRFNPLAMIARLHHSLSKKFKRSRPLGAHAGRLRSVTENMQEIIPYEAQHYDSDPDDEPTRSPTPIDPYGPGGKCEWLVPKTDMTLMEQKQRMEARERYIDDIRREYERLGMNITFSISGDPLKATTTVLGAQKKKKLNAMAENVELPNETQSSSQPGLGESSQAAPDNCQVPNSRPKRPLTIRKTTRQRREKVLRVISPDIAAEVNDLLESESETKESRVNEHQWWLGQTGYGDREREEWQLGLPAQDRPLSSSSESLRVSSTRWRQ